MLPQGAIAKLRVLTKKSRIGFGKHHDKTVADILICDKTYIAFAYYNIQHISFCDEILDEMELIRIDKPGKSDETFKAWRRAQSDKYTEEERRHGWMIHKRISKKAAKAKAVRSERYVSFTKGELQAINHGKM